MTGKYSRGEIPEGTRAETDDYTRARFTEENWAVLDAIREVSEEEGASPAQIALAWLLHKGVVDAPIIGPKRPGHLDEHIGALEVSLSEDQIRRIEAPKTPRWPAPGKDT